MRRDDLLGTFELLTGLTMLVGFVLILGIPALWQLLNDLVWAVGAQRALPTFGINPHWVAGARYAPSLLVLTACAALVVCYRVLTLRRRD